MRRTTALLYAAGAISVVTALAVGVAGASGRDEDDRIAAWAERAGHSAGDDHPRDIAWVATTESQASAGLSLGSSAVEDDRQVYVIQMRGHFVAVYATPPRGTPLPSGTVLTVVVDRHSGDVIDATLGDTARDLSGMGRVHRQQ